MNTPTIDPAKLAGAARAAAGAAAWDALQPTVEQLQRSAIDLYAAMVRIGRDQ